MDGQIALLLAQDGLTAGAIYALLALALVLVFAVTRVIFIPQGEFVAYGALTLASFEAGVMPGTVWLLLGAGGAAALADIVTAARRGVMRRRLTRIILWNVALPVLIALLVLTIEPRRLPLALQVVLALLIVMPLGPLLYRLAYQPLVDASVLVLLIVSVAVHLTLVGLGLVFFGAEGSRTAAFSDDAIMFAGIPVSGQTLWVLGASAALVLGLATFFGRSLYGKALRATASNRVGARLMGISTTMAGKITFTLAAAIGAFSGILIGPITTVFYDTGFLIGLKGFVGAIIGGLASYPVAAAGALLVGLLESYASFWSSAFKEVIVFTLIIPVLLWRSLTAHHVEEDE